MQSSKKFRAFKNIFLDALLKNRTFVAVMIPILGAVFVSCYYEILASSFFCKCIKVLKPCDRPAPGYETASDLTGYLYKYVKCYSLHCSIGFLHNYLFSTNSNVFKSMVYKHLVKVYMKMDYNSYHSIGSGKISSFIKKQANSSISMLEAAMIHLLYSIVYLILFYWNLFFCGDESITFTIKCLFSIISIAFSFYIAFCVYFGNIRKEKLIASEHTTSFVLLDILKNYNVIKAFNNESSEVGRFSETMNGPITFGRNYFLFTELTSTLFRIGCFAILVTFIYFGHNSKFTTSLYYLPDALTLIEQFKNLKSKTSSIKECILSISSKFIAAETCQFSVNDENKRSGVITERNIDIDFKDVEIHIDGETIFSGLNLLIKQGDKVAVTGRNGSGKSSIFMALLGFQKYNGSLKMNNVELSDLKEKSLRDSISYVPQEPHLFNVSVMDNLKYGNRKLSDEEVIQICRDCGTHEIFKSLKNGYQTIVGEDCRNVSGGQAQMINFMRGVIKNEPVFLLDEPTSNLDYSSSKNMLNYISTILDGKTVLCSTHNPDHLAIFDVIINIHDKKATIYKSKEDFENSPHYGFRL